VVQSLVPPRRKKNLPRTIFTWVGTGQSWPYVTIETYKEQATRLSVLTPQR
jgi:hypothetical protein